MKPNIGKTDAGVDMIIDVPRLLATRLLLEADSGGGKTVALKRLLEQTHSHVQQIIIDPEGEFSAMREKFDYLLCAPEGADAIATPKTATILARKLRETRVSAVLDIYDLRPREQREFVRLFVEELLAAPKNLWNPCLVVIDESQIFAPENGEAESLGAIMDLRGRGRKRGLCPILATPRLAQLSKDACAGLQNKMIGVTTLDLDVKRAARELSMTPTEATIMLRNLEPGEFFCFGPALTRTITKVKVGAIQTSHGQHSLIKNTRPPAPSEKIKDVIAKLTDLPKEAEQEARTLEDMKRENANLKRELTIAKKAQPKQSTTEIKTIEKPVVGIRAIKGIQDADASMRKTLKKLREAQEAIQIGLTGYQQQLEKLTIEFRKVQDAQRPPLPNHIISAIRSSSEKNIQLPIGEHKILSAVIQHHGCTRQQITVLTGYKRSSRDAYLQRLSTKGLVDINDQHVVATEHGSRAIEVEALPTGPELRNYWLNKLPDGESKIMSSLFAHYPEFVTREYISESTGYKRSSRDAYLQRLSARQLVVFRGRGEVMAAKELFS